MRREKPAPGSAEDWLARAKGDLSLAQIPLPEGGYYEDLCFHAQQAAEKALKAVILRHGWSFRYVHDLEELIAEIKRHGESVPKRVEKCVALTGFASEARYPGLGEPVTEAERQEAVTNAKSVVRWANKMIR